MSNLLDKNTVYGSFHGFGLSSPAQTYSHRPETITQTLNHDVAGFRSASQRFRADFGVWDVRGKRGSAAMMAWIIAKNGRLTPFQVTWPQDLSSKDRSGVTVVSQTEARADEITLTGLGTDGFGGLRFVVFGGHNKLYMLAPEPKAAISGGRATYEIEPALIARVNAGAAVDASPQGNVVLVGDYKVENINGIESRVRVTCQEVIT